MHAYIFEVSRSEGRATQRLPSRDVSAQAFPAFKVFTHAQLITRLYVAGKAWVPRLGVVLVEVQYARAQLTSLTLDVIHVIKSPRLAI